jgi:hypothetical protein
MRRVVAWLCSHPLTAGFLVLIGCAVGTHLFANWRAEVRWQRYCTEARARGVKLTLAEFAPPEIPDAENFAALPMMRATYTGGAQAAFGLPRSSGGERPYYNYAKGERIDFQVWAKFFLNAGFISETTDSPPRDVLLALDHYAPQFKEWSEWRSRPHCQFPIRLDASGMISTPNFGTFSNASQVFILRMRAHLASGDSPAALADFEDALQTYRAFENPPTLIAAVLRMGLLSLLCSQVGESLVDPAWSETELRQIQADLTAVNAGKDFSEGFAAERVSENLLFESLVRSPAERSKVGAVLFSASWQTKACRLIPGRVFRDNQLRQNQYLDEQLAKLSGDELYFDPDHQGPAHPDKLNGVLDDCYFCIFKLFAEAIGGMSEQSVRLQTRLNQTRIAIALERFRLARGAYPETLAELVPEFIAAVPVETYSRQPMIYRRQEGGTFFLYGVGKDRKDDGGAVDPKLHEKKQLDDIWLYAPPAR